MTKISNYVRPGAAGIVFPSTPGNAAPVQAVNVTYDNGTSGLTATNAQAAIDELESDIAGLGSPALDDLSDVTAPTPSDGDVLTFDSGTGDWVNAAPTGAADILDLPTAETDTTLVLAPDGAGGVEFRAETGRTGALEVVIDGGGSAISTGVKGDVEMPFAGTFTTWRLLADAAGAIVVDVWKDTYSAFPPTDADAMPGSGKEPTIPATNAKAEDTTITDWVTDDFNAGDILRFNVDSATTVTRVTLSLTYVRT